MSNPILVAIGLGVIGMLLGAIGLHYRRKAIGQKSVPIPGPSLVRILTTDDELRDAVRRAASFERVVADRMQTRARRYEAMVAPEQVTEIASAYPAHRRASGESTQRSA